MKSEIKEVLDACLEAAFPCLAVDVHTRWVAQLSDAPLFGAAKPLREEEVRQRDTGRASDVW